MGADPRVDDAHWLLDWISRTGQAHFSRRDAHQAARGRFRKAADLEPALALLEEHGWLRRVDADPVGAKGGRPASPRFLVNPLHPDTEPSQPSKPHPQTGSEGSEARVDTSGAAHEGKDGCHVIQREQPQPLLGKATSASDPLRPAEGRSWPTGGNSRVDPYPHTSRYGPTLPPPLDLNRSKHGVSRHPQARQRAHAPRELPGLVAAR